MKVNNGGKDSIWLVLLLIFFAKNLIQFFNEGGDKIALTYILLKLILILSLIITILNKEKIKEKNNEFLNQTKLDKYFCLNK